MGKESLSNTKHPARGVGYFAEKKRDQQSACGTITIVTANTSRGDAKYRVAIARGFPGAWVDPRVRFVSHLSFSAFASPDRFKTAVNCCSSAHLPTPPPKDAHRVCTPRIIRLRSAKSKRQQHENIRNMTLLMIRRRREVSYEAVEDGRGRHASVYQLW